MTASYIRYGLSLFLLLFISTVWAEISVPKLSQRVTDLTGTLTATQVAGLEEKLAALEAEKGSQIAVLIIPTTQPQDIAEYGIQVADLWRIGRKNIDDGLILIVAKNDRKLRIEVGRGLEGVIPDVIAKRIIADVITPYFKAGDFGGGIDVGVSQLIKLINGEELPAPKAQANGQQGGEGGYLFILIAGLFVGSMLSAIFGRFMGGMIAGIGSATLVSLLFGLGIAAVIVGIMVFFMIGVGRNGGGWSNGGGFGGGSSWGGGSSGGS
uniref:TPM domain-containing protein n=1 Tax=Crenothrix polyspora TaxID=360316 RepID=UPI0011784ABF